MQQPNLHIKKPATQGKKPRTLPRMGRRSEMLVEEVNDTAWAVSYSDLLMVLMSFFIIFFSFETPDLAKSAILEIASKITGDKVSVDAMGSDTSTVSFPHDKIKDDFQLLSALVNIDVESNNDELIMHFSDNIYLSGAFEPSPQIIAALKKFTEILLPYQDSIDIVVIGHSDSATLIPRNQFLSTNFDLSYQRAIRAAKHVADSGFPVRQIAAQASSYNVRNSRSLSFRVRVTSSERGAI